MSTAIETARAFTFGELTPWTEGNARIAVEEREEFGSTILLQDIVDADGEVLARVEYLPCASDEENKRAQFVLTAVNSHDALIAALQATFDAIEGDSRYYELFCKVSAALVEAGQ